MVCFEDERRRNLGSLSRCLALCLGASTIFIYLGGTQRARPRVASGPSLHQEVPREPSAASTRGHLAGVQQRASGMVGSEGLAYLWGLIGSNRKVLLSWAI